MSLPTTLAELSPSFLGKVLGESVVSVSREALSSPYTSLVEALDVSLEDGRTVQLVAKVARPDRANPRLYRQEVAFYQGPGIGVDCLPACRFAECDEDGQFLLILDRVVGVHVRDGWDEARARAALEAIATVHGACWGKAGLAPRKELSQALAQSLVSDVREHWEQILARFPRHLAAPPVDLLVDEVEGLVPTTLTHNDLHAENVLFDGARVVFVDWQNATFSTPMLDVANLVAGCVHPEVQRRCWRSLLAHYESSLQNAGGPVLPTLHQDYATATGMLFAWVCRYLGGVSQEEAAGRSMLLDHWERVSVGAGLARG